MMERNNFFAALDIGTNKIVCLIGKENGTGAHEVVNYSIAESAGIRRGVIVNIDETAGAITKAVKMASLDLGAEIKNVYVNITGQQFRTIERTLKKKINPGKIISKDDIKALRDEARDIDLPFGDVIYHMVNQSFTIDNEEMGNPIGAAGNQLIAVFRLIVAPDNYRHKIETCLNAAGLKMVKCIVNPFAAAESVLSDDEKEGGVVLVDFGAGTTSIALFYEGTLRHMSIVPFGGNVVTQDIREGCSILLRQAESLKVQFGKAIGDFAPDNMLVTIPGINGWEPKELSVKSLAYIIQARMEEIVESVAFQIEQSGYTEKLAAGIVMTGNGALLENLGQLMRFKTGLDVRIGYPMIKLSPSMEKVLDAPGFATSMGLLKMAMNDEAATNEELIIKKKAKKERSGFSFGGSVVQKLSLLFNEEQDSEL
jgi:cell division protein FtsA